MVSSDTNTTSVPLTIPPPLTLARRRVRFALRRAEDGLLDYDTMDDICTALSNALCEMGDADPESAGGMEPPSGELWVALYSESCAVCGARTKEPLAVDRCRRTGEVRGLLCRRCHAAVEYLDGDAMRAQKLADYLRDSHREEEH